MPSKEKDTDNKVNSANTYEIAINRRSKKEVGIKHQIFEIFG